jgi:hypothetical protein
MERIETARLTERLLVKAQAQEEELQRLRRAPGGSRASNAGPIQSGGAAPAEDYQPHDIKEILSRLRKAVGPGI